MDMIREDRLDQVYKTEVEKFEAVLADIKGCYERGQPVLVGTTSIENSEKLAAMLQKADLPHQVLNAKQHAYEAQIIAQAGRPKMITIATNMAGRGTDIVLGGNVEKQVDVVKADPGLDEAGKEARIAALRAEWRTLHQQVVDAGGLHIIGTERHESRRIDNQLRGRSGRQGDPGSSRFYLALDDQLLRIFAGERIRAIMERLKMPEGEPIEHTLVTRSIESAQRKVEAHNFDIRKQLLEYDNVANDQRKNVYELRNRILENQGLAEMVKDLRDGVVTDIFRAHVPPESVEEQWDIPGLESDLQYTVGLHIPAKTWLEEEPNLGEEALLERILEASDAAYAARMSQVPADAVAHTERYVLLQILDQHWREHLGALDHLRQGIHLRGYAQKNPKQEYKREAFELFGAMLETVKLEVTRILTHLDLKTPEQVREMERLEAEARAPEKVQYQHPALEEALVGAGAETEAEEQVATLRKPAPFVRQMGKVGRNDPCPCGSGKKFKHCHGRLS